MIATITSPQAMMHNSTLVTALIKQCDILVVISSVYHNRFLKYSSVAFQNWSLFISETRNHNYTSVWKRVKFLFTLNFESQLKYKHTFKSDKSKSPNVLLPVAMFHEPTVATPVRSLTARNRNLQILQRSNIIAKKAVYSQTLQIGAAANVLSL